MNIFSLLVFPYILFLDGAGLADNRTNTADQRHVQLESHLTGDAEREHHNNGEPKYSAIRKAPGWLPIVDMFRQVRVRQVRIERRVIVRITPLSPKARSEALANARTLVPVRLVEQPVSGCIPINGIAGVSADRGDRLRLYMRGRQILSARLGKTCPAEAFYSGFYVERNSDGMLCPARDIIQSRSGVRCTVGRISRLVAERAE